MLYTIFDPFDNVNFSQPLISDNLQRSNCLETYSTSCQYVYDGYQQLEAAPLRRVFELRKCVRYRAIAY